MSLKLTLSKLSFLGLWFVSFIFVPQALASSVVPEITNDNAHAKAYFWLKKTDGTTEIISIPPQSKKALPVNVVEIQYLYMEGKGSEPALPELSTIELMPPSFSTEEEESATVLEENLPASTSKPGLSLKEEARRIDEGYTREVELSRTPVPTVQSIENPSKIRRFFEENW